MDYYYHPMSPNCRKVTALIGLLGLEVEHHVVDLAKGEQLSPEYLAVNPFGAVPTLVDGDLKLPESNAIMVYLSEQAGSDLWPVDERRIEVLQWLFWEQSNLQFATGTAFFQRLIRPMLGQEPDEQRVAEAIAKFRRHAKVLDDHLADRQWVAGDAMTIADLAIASQMMYAKQSGLPIDEFPHIERWQGALDGVPAWHDTEAKLVG
jgi:glutathione S-transferase